MKALIVLAAMMIAGCASTQSSVVCSGDSKGMTCHPRTAEVVVEGRRVVDTGK